VNDSGTFSIKIPTGAFYRIFQVSNVRKKTPDVNLRREFIIDCLLGFYMIRAVEQAAIIG
jgi:hypothetical protein